MMQYGLNFDGKNLKDIMMKMNNERNTTENLLIYTGAALFTKVIKCKCKYVHVNHLNHMILSLKRVVRTLLKSKC